MRSILLENRDVALGAFGSFVGNILFILECILFISASDLFIAGSLCFLIAGIGRILACDTNTTPIVTDVAPFIRVFYACVVDQIVNDLITLHVVTKLIGVQEVCIASEFWIV
eukprot:m.168122 g.168122  ORF g.168122 m.168122 type:complete len:112 (+) comp14470_c0_seq2:745-1080(+)